MCFGCNVGTEIIGKGSSRLRPGIVVKKFYKNAFLVVPVTSVRKKRGTYYHHFVDTKGSKQCALLTQARYFDSKRLKYRMSRVSHQTLEVLKDRYCRIIKK